MRTILVLFITICSLQLLSCQSKEANLEVIEETMVSPKAETTTMYFIRHAEKDRSDKANRNPHLTEEGHARAKKWAAVFSNVRFDVIYSTDYNRTKETATPSLEKTELKGLTMYDPRALDGEAFAKDNKGKTVLVVGHSNTTPEFVNAVLGEKKFEWIEDNNNANLYVLTISASGDKSVVLLKID